MNNTRTERSSSSSLARRVAALLAGFAVLVGVVVAATPARAEGKLAMEISTSGLVVTFSVTGCSANSAAALYDVGPADAIDGPENSRAVPGWTAGDTEFTFSWTAPKPGTYAISLACLGYATEGDVYEQDFIVYDPTDPNLSINPTTWRAGDQVTLTAEGLKAGEDVTFSLGFTTELDAVAAWKTKADANGVATLTVTWPAKSPAGPILTKGYYVASARAASLGEYYHLSVWVYLDADGVWSVRPSTRGGELPTTGD